MQLTHVDCLPGEQVWQQVLHGEEQPQLVFCGIAVPLGVGTSDGCAGVATGGAENAGAGSVEYLTTCVLIGVSAIGLLGATGFVWLDRKAGSGLLVVVVVSKVCGCFSVGAVVGLGCEITTGAWGRGGIEASDCFTGGAVTKAGFGTGTGAGGSGGIVVSRVGVLGCGGRRIGCGVTNVFACVGAGCIGGAFWAVAVDGGMMGQPGCGVGRSGCGAATGVAGFRLGCAGREFWMLESDAWGIGQFG